MAEKSRAGRILDIVDPDRGRLELAWVRDEARNKIRLRTLGGREISLSARTLDEATLADHGPAGPEPLETLARRGAETDAERARIAPDDLDLLWEAVADDDDSATTLAALAGELLGSDAPATRVSALGRTLEADGDRFALRVRGARFVVFGRRTRAGRARRAEEDARRAERRAREREEAAARVAADVARLRPLLDDAEAPWPSDLEPLQQSLLDVCRFDRRLDDTPRDEAAERHARGVAAAIEGTDAPWVVRALAERLLRRRHRGESRTRRTRRLLGLTGEFAPEVVAAAAAAAAAEVERLDLGDVETIAVDDPWTRLRDDALSVIDTGGGLEVHVHVADATAVVRGGELDGAARRRTVAHYWPDGTIPMLPPELAEARLSLDADGATRPAFTAQFRCGEDDGGATLELLRLGPTTVRIAANRTYEEVDAAIARPATDADALLLRLWEHLAAVRRRRGGPEEGERPEVRLIVEGDGERIERRETVGGTPARRVIEELALATGMAVARWARERDVPLIYRVQDAPRGGRGGMRATYTLTPDEHHAMGGALYAHVTSPLRRYVDLLNQRQLLSRLAGGAVEVVPQVDLQRIVLDLRDAADRARDLEREAHRYWALRWLATRPEETFDAELRLEPQLLDGGRPPRVWLRAVSLMLPLAEPGGILERARAAAGAAPSPAAAVLPLRVRVEVRDAEALAACATPAAD